MTFPPHTAPPGSTGALLRSRLSTMRCYERGNALSVHSEPFAFWAACAHGPTKSRRTLTNTPVTSVAPVRGIAPPHAPLWLRGQRHGLLEASQSPNTPRQPSHIAQ